VGIVHEFDVITECVSEGSVFAIDGAQLLAGDFWASGLGNGDARFDGIESLG